jgi:hypothetical protein
MGLFAVLGVFRVLGVLVGVLGILLIGVLLGLGVFALLHVRHLLFNSYSVSMAGKIGTMRQKSKKCS